MVSFTGFVLTDDLPIYAQIVRYIRRGVAAGGIRDGDELPSRRVLSALLGVNPNTVQKAYRLLEEEGVLESRAGASSYIVLDEERRARIRAELMSADARAFTVAMRQMGAERDEALALAARLWEEE